MSEADRVRYADDKVKSTQASASKADIAPIQYTPAGKALTLFGTYGINQWNWLLREVVGKDNPDISKAEAVKKMTRYVAATAIVNGVYEFCGSSAPAPAPVTAFMEEMEKPDASLVGAFFEAAKEALTILPVGGRAGSWGGKSLLGAPVMTFVELFDAISGQPDAPPIASVMAKLAGMPGSQTVWKIYKLIKKQGKTVDPMKAMQEFKKELYKELYGGKGKPSLSKMLHEMSEEEKSAFDKFMNYRIPR